MMPRPGGVPGRDNEGPGGLGELDRPDGLDRIDGLSVTGRLACLASALSSPTRLKILKLVQQEELCVCELAAILGVSQPAVSQHMVKLRESGLAVERRVGQMALYSAAGAGERVCSGLLSWLDLALDDCAELEGWKDRLAGARLRRACVEGPATEGPVEGSKTADTADSSSTEVRNGSD
jgi:ArsR family transcriptional regulator